jgi:anti-sigma B factor antagonist
VSDLATVRIRERGHIVIATVEGEVDLSNRAPLAARLVDAVENSATGLMLDLSALEFMDSSGVHMLYELSERLATRQQRFAVVLPPNRPPRRVIELSGVEPAGWLHAETSTALAALGG